MVRESRDRERPEGMSDFVGRDMAHRIRVRQKLLELFMVWGYEQVETPMLEYVDTFANGVLGGEEELLYRMFDPFGRTLAVRPEMTTPVARLSATILAKDPLPLRLCYDAKTYRLQPPNKTDRVEVTQAGIELIGQASPDADAEMIALLIESMRSLGVRDFALALGHMGLVRALLAPLDATFREPLREALIDKDLVSYERIVDLAKPFVPESIMMSILQLPRLRGDVSVIGKARELAFDDKARLACDELLLLWHALEDYGVASFIHFDLGSYLHHDYYTGVVVEAYAEALGHPIAFGGRYDHLLGRFGCEQKATGFAIQVERLMAAIKETPPLEAIHTVYYDETNRKVRLDFAKWLRANGHRIVAMPQDDVQRAKNQDAWLDDQYALYVSQEADKGGDVC